MDVDMVATSNSKVQTFIERLAACVSPSECGTDFETAARELWQDYPVTMDRIRSAIDN